MLKSEIIMRKTLEIELENIFNFSSTVAIAPMGYGKTVAAVEYLKKKNIHSIWLSLETIQTEYQNIWDTFCRQLNKTLSSKLSELGFPIDIKKRNYFFEIISEYIKENKTILVIDDYHFTESKEVNEFIYLLIKAEIKNLHILILTRTTPEINIEELKLKDKCYMIKGDKFILTKSEVAKYFRQNKVTATKDIIDKTYEFSEGWISAVKLMAEKYNKTGNLENILSIENLIKETIISKYNEDEIDILTKLCILDSFTLEQASFVIDITKDKIEKTIGKSTFIRYDEKNEDYKTHNILNNYLLKYRFKNVTNKNELYKRSGIWYTKNNQIINGINYFLLAKDYDSILKEYEKNSSAEIFIRYRQFMYKTFKQITEKLTLQYPIACLNYASFLITVFNYEEGSIYLSKLDGYYRETIEIKEEEKQKILGEIQHLASILQYNNIENMVESFKKAYYLLGGKSNICNIKKQATLGSTSTLFSYHIKPNNLKKVTECIHENFKYYEMLSSGCGRGMGELTKAEYYLEILDIENAKLYANKALLLARTNLQLDIILLVTYIIARVKIYKGENNKALDLLINLPERLQVELHPTATTQYDICLSNIYFMIGRYNSITEWIKKGDFTNSNLLFLNSEINYIVYGKSLVLKKEYLKLELLCSEMIYIMKPFNYIFGYIHTYILEAIAKFNLYGIDSSINAINKAISLCENDNIHMTLIEYGKEVLPILKYSKNKGDYLLKIIDEIQMQINLLENSNVTLTSREREILQLVKQNKTNREIVETLYIAEVTVKKSLSNIYKKYGVKNKKELLEKYY